MRARVESSLNACTMSWKPETISPVKRKIQVVALSSMVLWVKSRIHESGYTYEQDRNEVTFGNEPIPVKLPPTDKHPMICVDWHNATAYAKWAGKRLPTGKEWDCRNISATIFSLYYEQGSNWV